MITVISLTFLFFCVLFGFLLYNSSVGLFVLYMMMDDIPCQPGRSVSKVNFWHGVSLAYTPLSYPPITTVGFGGDKTNKRTQTRRYYVCTEGKRQPAVPPPNLKNIQNVSNKTIVVRERRWYRRGNINIPSSYTVNI